MLFYEKVFFGIILELSPLNLQITATSFQHLSKAFCYNQVKDSISTIPLHV